MVRWNSGFIEGTCLLAALQNSADVLLVTLPTLICLNTSFITVRRILSIGPYPLWGLVLLPLKNDARTIARSKYENKFRTNLYCTAITPKYKPS